jgi:membrane-bound lytic murein transglycosylase A
MPLSRKTLSALRMALGISFAAAFVAALLVFVLFPDPAPKQFGPAQIAVEPIGFSDIPGWAADDQVEALAPFARSCARIAALAAGDPVNALEALGPADAGTTLSGDAADWRPACDEAQRLIASPTDAAGARAFFETHFAPLRVLSVETPVGLRRPRKRVSTIGRLTGYFEPVYPASRAQDARFSAPALARPADLVTVELGEFRAELAGERIAGSVENGRLRPYPDHHAINSGALSGKASVIAFMDPDDLLFLQIQGSGRLTLDDGSELRLGYDGANGRPYTAIGKVLVERGALAKEEVSMQTIRAWLDAAPEAEARALREANESYVFFKPLDAAEPRLGPLGSEGVALTAMRSAAIDRRYFAFGTPVWIAAPAVPGRSPAIAHLVVAQDSGGAIKGPVRADLFVGSGAVAGELAGVLNAELEMIALIPKPLAARLPRRPA